MDLPLVQINLLCKIYRYLWLPWDTNRYLWLPLVAENGIRDYFCGYTLNHSYQETYIPNEIHRDVQVERFYPTKELLYKVCMMTFSIW